MPPQEQIAPSAAAMPQAQPTPQPPQPQPGMAGQTAYQQPAASMPNRNINVQPVQFGGFQGVPAAAEQTNLDLLLDIPLRVTVELGRTKLTIRNLLQLAHGSVVELDGLAGEPMDVLVNGTLIAQGEVVVVNDKFGIRLTDIITPAERMRKIRH